MHSVLCRGCPVLIRDDLLYFSRLHVLQPDLRFKAKAVLMSLRRLNSIFHIWPRRQLNRHIQREAIMLSTMCTHVWKGTKSDEPWLDQLGIAREELIPGVPATRQQSQPSAHPPAVFINNATQHAQLCREPVPRAL